MVKRTGAPGKEKRRPGGGARTPGDAEGRTGTPERAASEAGPNERNEATRLEKLVGPGGLARSDQETQALVVALPDGEDEPAAHGELLAKRLGDLVGGRG